MLLVPPGGTSNIQLHVVTVTDQLELAQEVYAKVEAVYEAHNVGHADDGTRMLVELTHVDKDVPDTLVLYLGSGAQNNNKRH